MGEVRSSRSATRLIWALLVLGTAVALLQRYLSLEWFIAANGHVGISDFLDLWAAGVRAASGHAALAYDVARHTAFQQQLTNIPSELPYPYPPPFFFFLVPFAGLAYQPAAIAFLVATYLLYAAALNVIVKDKATAALMALSFGGAFHTIFIVQVGYLSAALLVGGLALLPRRPLLAGVLFGLLTVKPQLGIALTIALLLGREWRTIGVALATAATIALAAEGVFGGGIWMAYLPAAQNQAGLLLQDRLWYVLSSVFAIAYPLVGPRAALIVQLASSVVIVAVFCRIWRRQPNYEVRAAALIASTLLMSPYTFAYDAAMLTGAAAFLWKDDAPVAEKGLILLACILPGFTLQLRMAAVPIAACLMLYLAWRRPAAVLPTVEAAVVAGPADVLPECS